MLDNTIHFTFILQQKGCVRNPPENTNFSVPSELKAYPGIIIPLATDILATQTLSSSLNHPVVLSIQSHKSEKNSASFKKMSNL